MFQEKHGMTKTQRMLQELRNNPEKAVEELGKAMREILELEEAGKEVPKRLWVKQFALNRLVGRHNLERGWRDRRIHQGREPENGLGETALQKARRRHERKLAKIRKLPKPRRL